MSAVEKGLKSSGFARAAAVITIKMAGMTARQMANAARNAERRIILRRSVGANRSIRAKTEGKERPSKRSDCDETSSTTSSDSQDLEVFVIHNINGVRHPVAKVMLNGFEVKFIVDSGSSIVCLDKKAYESVGKPKLKPAAQKIFAYGAQEPLQVKGYFRGELEVNGRSAIFKIFVVDESKCGCILSKTASEELKLLHLTPIVEYESVNAVKTLQKIGKLKGVQVKLHIDDSIPPVAQPHRRIPYHLRSAAESQIKELEAQGVIAMGVTGRHCA